MATLAVQQIPVTGFTPTFTAAAAGLSDACNPDDRVFLRVKNGGAQITLTVVVPGTAYGQALADPAITIPATTGDVLINLPASLQDPATGLVTWTYSATASVTVALVRV